VGGLGKHMTHIIFLRDRFCLSSVLDETLICFSSVCVFVNRSVVKQLRLRFFTDFYQVLRAVGNVVVLMPIVCGTDQK